MTADKYGMEEPLMTSCRFRFRFEFGEIIEKHRSRRRDTNIEEPAPKRQVDSQYQLGS